MHNTVLQQGDQIGTTGDTGSGGSTGATGAQGAFTNVLSVKLVYTFPTPNSPTIFTLTKTYVVEAGTSGFWKASGDHSYVNTLFTVNPGTTTISNFLETITKKFSVHLQHTKTKIEDSSGNIILLPINISKSSTAEIYDISDDNIVIRFVQKVIIPVSFQTITNSRTQELTFSLLIIGTDQ